jgi:hypothetical protein
MLSKEETCGDKMGDEISANQESIINNFNINGRESLDFQQSIYGKKKKGEFLDSHERIGMTNKEDFSDSSDEMKT